MSDAVIVAIIGGAAGITTALTTGAIKVYELIKASKEKSLEDRVKPIIVEALEPTNRRLDAVQLDVTRMRLMSLIRNEPSDAENILIIAKIYFVDMGGNSEASKLFARWLKQENIKKPAWFKERSNNDD